MLRRDGTQIRCMRSPPASFSGLRETRASGPGAGREVGLEEGDAEVYSGKRHRSRSNSALPAFGSQADTPATTDHQSTFATRGTREVFSRVPAQLFSSCSYGRGGGVGYGLGVGLGLGGPVGVDVGVAVGVVVAVPAALAVAVGVCVAVAVAVAVAVGVCVG